MWGRIPPEVCRSGWLPGHLTTGGGVPASQFILPLAVGIAVFLTISGIVVAMSPQPDNSRGPAPERIRIDLFPDR